MTNEVDIEKEIQDKGLNAPRLTPDLIDAAIKSEHYFTAADAYRFGWLTHDHDDKQSRDAVLNVSSSLRSRSYSGACIDIDANANTPSQLKLLTFCVLILRNGYTVTGESACASPENFNAEIGRKIARSNARDKIWQLEGYLLKDKLFHK